MKIQEKIEEMQLESFTLQSRRYELEAELATASRNLETAQNGLISGSATTGEASVAQSEKLALESALVGIGGQIEELCARIAKAEAQAVNEERAQRMIELAGEAGATLAAHDAAWVRACELLRPQIETMLDAREKLVELRSEFRALKSQNPSALPDGVSLSAICADWGDYRFDFDLPCAEGVFSAFQSAGNARAREKRSEEQRDRAAKPIRSDQPDTSPPRRPRYGEIELQGYAEAEVADRKF